MRLGTYPRRRLLYLAALALFLLPLDAGLLTSSQPQAAASPVPSSSFFGMNLYVTGQERPKQEKLALMDAATDLGVQRSREEMSWANIEPYKKGSYNWGGYDTWINELVSQGFNIVGTIQTSPSWASGASTNLADWYWYAPQNPQDFVDFAYAAALHYKGRIRAWEIWNEPDVEMTFKCNGCNRPAVYAQMLAGSYAAIKKADPQATVLIGGLSIHDYHNAGMAFLDQVVAASNGQLNFDVLSIHPYMPDRPPESTDPNTVVQNFPYRLDMSYKWLQAHAAADKQIWITEDGYSTCDPCGTLGVSEDEQAKRLVRLYAIAMAAPNVTQFDYFQIKDKFNAGSTDLWGNMAIMRNDLSHKPAYSAYKTLTHQLVDATYAGQGPLMHQVQNRWQVQFDRYHYLFSTPAGKVQVIWDLSGQETVSVPVSQPNIQVLDYLGRKVSAAVSNGAVSVTISDAPLYIIETSQQAEVLDPATDPSSPTGFMPSKRFAQFWQNNGGLPLFGYAISGERLEKSPTNGKQYIVQWFERARFEWHPENQTPYDVLLGLLGSQLVQGRQFPQIAPPSGVESVCVQATGHCVWGRFLQRWRELGIPIVGLPLSDQVQETSTDGKSYVVQYFERARFEYHPDYQQPYDVLLGLLGRQLYKP